MKAIKGKTKQCINAYTCMGSVDGVQPLTNFHKYARSKDGLKDECKECRLYYQRQYDAENAATRAIKRRVYKVVNFSDERQMAYNYIAKKLGLNVRQPVIMAYGETGVEREQINRDVRNRIKKNFKNAEELRVAFNLLSRQLGSGYRA